MTSMSCSRKMRNGPKPGVGSTGRGLTLNQDQVDWRATVNGTQNAPTGAPQFKPGDRVLYKTARETGHVLAVDGGQLWLRLDSGDSAVAFDCNVTHLPAHPIPSEPGHYQDESGRHWLHQVYDGSVYGAPERDTDQWINPLGQISDPTGYELTRLVPEGSEREAAIREVVDWLKYSGWETVPLDIERHFLSGAGQ